MKALVAALVITAALAPAQTIVGIVSGPDGPLATAELRLRASNGPAYDTTSAANGTYTFIVPSGTYDLFVNRTGYGPSTKRSIALAAGATVHVDISLSPNTNFGTPGEFTGLELRDHTPIITGPVPRATDGHPDLSGVWLPSPPVERETPLLKPWAAALAAKRTAAGTLDDPRALCLPTGTPRTNNADLTKFVQTPGVLVILMEAASPGYRQVFLYPNAKHPEDPEPSWMGDSVGHWDGDTLVVDTIGFNDRGSIDGTIPQTAQLHVIERFHRLTRGTMEVALTIDDPGVFDKPWHFTRVLHLTETEDIREAICNENNHTEHYTDQSVLH